VLHLGVDVPCQEIVSRPHASLSKIRFLLLSGSVLLQHLVCRLFFVREPPVRVVFTWISPICRVTILAEQGRRRLVSSLPRFSGPALRWFTVLLPRASESVLPRVKFGTSFLPGRAFAGHDVSFLPGWFSILCLTSWL
jgi:hypothetical protein